MTQDRFEQALSESDTAEILKDAQQDALERRSHTILETWALSIVSRLDPVLESFSSFGAERGRHRVSYPYANAAELHYDRSGKTLRLEIVANAVLEIGDRFHAGILIGDNFEDNSATMSVSVARSDTGGSKSADFRYGLQPVSKITSINADLFLSFLEQLVRGTR